MSSVGIKTCKILQQENDLYIHLSGKIKLWDVAPCLLLIEEARGFTCDRYGNAISFKNLNKKLEISNGFFMMSKREIFPYFLKKDD